MKAIVIGILASLFFAVTFILNRAMELSGGSWLWSSSLRFIFMVPFLCVIVIMRGHSRLSYKRCGKSRSFGSNGALSASCFFTRRSHLRLHTVRDGL